MSQSVGYGCDTALVADGMTTTGSSTFGGGEDGAGGWPSPVHRRTLIVRMGRQCQAVLGYTRAISAMLISSDSPHRVHPSTESSEGLGDSGSVSSMSSSMRAKVSEGRSSETASETQKTNKTAGSISSSSSSTNNRQSTRVRSTLRRWRSAGRGPVDYSCLVILSVAVRASFLASW